MDEFYTNETQTAIWNQEMENEKLYNALIDAYDPYMDFDDYFEDDFEDEEPDPDQGREDAGMEGYLFGWDA